MNATLVDFYYNVALISCWIYLRERSKLAAVFWILVSAGPSLMRSHVPRGW